MRTTVIGLAAALALTMGSQAAGAMPSGPGSAVVAPTSPGVPAVCAKCPKGQRWVPGNYAKRGRYRAGHCVPA